MRLLSLEHHMLGEARVTADSPLGFYNRRSLSGMVVGRYEQTVDAFYVIGSDGRRWEQVRDWRVMPDGTTNLVYRYLGKELT